MQNNREKPSYALDPLVARDWELRANGILLEELLVAYAQQQGSDMQAMEWFTATNTTIGIAYTYGLHPNASAGRPYDGMWKREYAGGGSVIVAYAEEPETRQVYVGIPWQRRRLHHSTMPVLAVPRGYTQMPERGKLFARQSKEVVEHLHRQTALLELTEEMVKGTIRLELLDDADNPAAGCFFTEVAIGRLTRYLQRKGYPLLCNN